MSLNHHLHAERLAHKLTSKTEIVAWLEKMEIENFKVEEAGVSVQGSVNLMSKNLEFLPVDFKSISGNLDLSMNRLRSLEGCPMSVQGFYASNNQLTTLLHAPQYVFSNFDVDSNRLISLAYAPKVVDGVFDCSRNKLTVLDCATEKVSSHFNALANPFLILNTDSLRDFETQVGGYLYYQKTDWHAIIATQDAGPGSTSHRIKGTELGYLQEKIKLEKATNLYADKANQPPKKITKI